MIIKLTEYETRKEIYFDTAHHVYMKVMGTAKPRTYIGTRHGALEVEESPDVVLGIMKSLIIVSTSAFATNEEIIEWLDRHRPSSYVKVRTELCVTQRIRD